MIVLREIQADGWRVHLDVSGQVLELEIPEMVSGWGKKDFELPLLPLLPRLDNEPVSAAALLFKAKQFDDGLFAAVERAAQSGAGRFSGKAALLLSLAEVLASSDTEANHAAAAFVFAACKLGGLPVTTPSALEADVHALRSLFLADELRSKPLSFYTWAPDLQAIFHQDRFLQAPLDPMNATALIRALEKATNGWDSYDAVLRLAARLTNPPDTPSLRDVGDRRSFLPPSRSHEVDLLERLYRGRPIPDGFDLMTELIRRVRSGDIQLQPTERSGWYDHQTWSLEPLLLPERQPEAPRLELGKRYRRHLEDLFRGILALMRETHVKGGRGGYGGGRTQRPIYVNPELTVEPLPTLYARRAACYRFVQTVLEVSFGYDALRALHRLMPEGSCKTSLVDELGELQRLFDGAAATARQELGMESASANEPSQRSFADWRASISNDQDLRRDGRMMVPVFYDLQRRKTKVWAFLGWRQIPVDVDYRKEPQILAVEPSTERSPPVAFSSARYELATPVMAEVYVDKLLDRDEFRRHCNRYQTQAAILANLC